MFDWCSKIIIHPIWLTWNHLKPEFNGDITWDWVWRSILGKVFQNISWSKIDFKFLQRQCSFYTILRYLRVKTDFQILPTQVLKTMYLWSSIPTCLLKIGVGRKLRKNELEQNILFVENTFTIIAKVQWRVVQASI